MYIKGYPLCIQINYDAYLIQNVSTRIRGPLNFASVEALLLGFVKNLFLIYH